MATRAATKTREPEVEVDETVTAAAGEETAKPAAKKAGTKAAPKKAATGARGSTGPKPGRKKKR